MSKPPLDMRKAYDPIAPWYDKNRGRELLEKKYFQYVVDRCTKGSSILDLGCGMGEPIAAFFIAEGFKVTGVDCSRNLLELCQTRFPSHRWLHSDMCALDLDETYAAVLAWDSFFHLTFDEQRSMFPVFQKHTALGGILIFTSGPEHGEAWAVNGGQDLYHASLSASEYEELLTKHGFKVITHVVNDPDCGRHTVWVAEKI